MQNRRGLFAGMQSGRLSGFVPYKGTKDLPNAGRISRFIRNFVDMKVALCQFSMEWEAAARNLRRAEELVAQAGADLALLPEMFATGFVTEPWRTALPDEEDLLGGRRFVPLVWYDLRCAVWCRCRCDYDAILCVASWPAPRREVWRTLLRARAIETQCYVVGVNRTGDDPWNHYAGDSAVVDFKGTPLCEADASEGVFTARLDREALDRFRTKFPAWRDADDFLLR